MIDHQEAWQLFASNGQPEPGQSILPDTARASSEAAVGAVHIWMWRQAAGGERSVLVQQRADTKPTWPGHLDISVAGHVDTGETLQQAICREAHEEVGYTIDSTALVYVFSYRNFTTGLKWVYTYEIEGDPTFVFTDREVAALRWIPLADFEEMTHDPAAHRLVPHPPEYYSLLMSALHAQ